MAETAKKTTQKRAKGTTKNERRGRAKTQHPDAEAKPARKRKTATAAKAVEKQAAQSCRDKRAAKPDEEETGIGLLKKKLDALLKMDPEKYAGALMRQTLDGKSTSIRTVVELAEQHAKEKTSSKRSRRLMQQLQRVAQEAEFGKSTDPTNEVGQSAREPEQAPLAA